MSSEQRHDRLNLIVIATASDDFVWFPFPLRLGIGLTTLYLHGVRWADREIGAGQSKIEDRAQKDI